MSSNAKIRRYDPLEVKEGFLQIISQSPDSPQWGALVRSNPTIQERVVNRAFPAEEFYPEDQGFCVYNVKEPLYSFVNPRFVFQDASTFVEEWYEACDEYVKELAPREKYILYRYTRHGDEIVNTYMRDPDGFMTNPRIHTLLTETMPNEQTMLYAMQLVDLYDNGNYSEYCDEHGNTPAFEYNELLSFESQYLHESPGESYMDKVVSLIHAYITDLQYIIENAPRITAPLQVFRCSQDDYLNTPYQAIQVAGFLSTSLDSTFSETYSRNNFVYQMILQPGTPCLSIKRASKYYHEFEVLVGLNCYAMPSELMEKHTLQHDVETSAIHPDHIFSGPLNPVRMVRHIQLTGPSPIGGYSRVSMLRKLKTLKTLKTQKTQKLKSRTPRSAKTLKTRKTTKRSPKTLKSRQMTKRTTPSFPSTPSTKPWENRDLLPPRIVTQGIPASVQAKLLKAHKQMGTYFSR